MDEKCRDHIIKNVQKLIEYSDYQKLMNACVYSGLLLPVMRHKVEDVGPLCDDFANDAEQLQHERHRRLFVKLTKRGPTAYQRIMTLLRELKCEEAVQLLNVPLNDDNFVSLRNAAGRGGGGGGGGAERERTQNGSSTQEAQNGESKPVGQAEAEVDGNNWCKSKSKDDTMPKLEQFTGRIEPQVVHVVQKSTYVHIDPKVGIYPMRSKHNRGVLFMVNIIDFPHGVKKRGGAEEDSKSLLHLFKELGFKLFSYKNLTQEEFFHLLDLIIDSEYTRDTECFVMALMTHGNMDDNWDRVMFHDGSVVKVREIEDRFENRKCLNLVGKPKILIFPFCRGDIPDYGHYRVATQTESFVEQLQVEPMRAPIQHNIPTLSDIFICHASMRGFMAHRDPVLGSWYIEKFCEMMAKHAHDTAFDDIVKMIDTETSKLRTSKGAMQTSGYVGMGFKKKLFFNPGVFEE